MADIDLGDIGKILWENYNIAGQIQKLDGEVDFNYKVTSDQGVFILKLSAVGTEKDYMMFQNSLINHVSEKEKNNSLIPQLVLDVKGRDFFEIKDKKGNIRNVRLLTWIEGKLWSEIHPKTEQMRTELGRVCGRLTHHLLGFNHRQAERYFEWNLDCALWTKDFLNLLDDEIKVAAAFFIHHFEANTVKFQKLRKSVIHNDANDNNIVCNFQDGNPKITLIDFGDAVYSAAINDLAVAITYAVMELPDPLSAACQLVKGYHESFPLQDQELKMLHTLVGMRLVISLTKAAINKSQNPDNIYLQISAEPAKRLLLKWRLIHDNLAYYAFRNAIGLHGHPAYEQICQKIQTLNVSIFDIFNDLNIKEIVVPDMSVTGTFLPHRSIFDDPTLFENYIDQWQKSYPDTLAVNGYLEVRPFYSTDAYRKESNEGPEYRTTHLGIDVWVVANTPFYSPLAGTVFSICNNDNDKDYGPTIILKHEIDSIAFYTLYGHLSKTTLSLHKIGDQIKQGQLLGYIGHPKENGNWAPHLHFQIILDMLGYEYDFPGVAFPRDKDLWKTICPDPSLLFGIISTKPSEVDHSQMLEYRKQHLGKSLSLSYKQPLHIVRGEGNFLIDDTGRKYLDTVNNVAHVGHQNINVINAGIKQMQLLNTNTRYLHTNILKLAENVLSTMPSELSVVHFVNSGSEANELALRMAYQYTQSNQVIALDHGYHGNTNECIKVSAYKFNGKGGQGCPANTHLMPLPDAFRGLYRGENTGAKYASHIHCILDTLQHDNQKLAAFIHESIVSCGGQIELPKGFLNEVYQMVKSHGGINIADEVQTGLGRVGDHWWAFQQHSVIPDIVTIGKPLGNGHPIGAVVCTREVADAFANGMEFFNTFGGNPVSCAIANAVINEVKDKKLMDNAIEVGNFLKQGLIELQTHFPIITDVRGQGLFLGFELTDNNLNPLANQTSYLSNRMRQLGILTSTDGPDHNVIKIKPPMTFNSENATEFLSRLEQVLGEDGMKV
jgi:4-aminobutyrate aminotransferase-like enzyme/Ser/Thr protein kinase RdoA (MazF antagonist)